MNKRVLGAAYEELAAEYLQARGVAILEKNYRAAGCEIDLIGEMDEYLIFVEVKYRKNEKYGDPTEAVSLRKQQHICRAAGIYCCKKQVHKQIRYDVVSVCGEKIVWYENAFSHRGAW